MILDPEIVFIKFMHRCKIIYILQFNQQAFT